MAPQRNEMYKNKLAHGCLNDTVYFGNLLRAMIVLKSSINAKAKPLMGSVVQLSHFTHSENLEEVEYLYSKTHTQNAHQFFKYGASRQNLKLIKNA